MGASFAPGKHKHMWVPCDRLCVSTVHGTMHARSGVARATLHAWAGSQAPTLSLPENKRTFTIQTSRQQEAVTAAQTRSGVGFFRSASSAHQLASINTSHPHNSAASRAVPSAQESAPGWPPADGGVARRPPAGHDHDLDRLAHQATRIQGGLARPPRRIARRGQRMCQRRGAWPHPSPSGVAAALTTLPPSLL